MAFEWPDGQQAVDEWNTAASMGLNMRGVKNTIYKTIEDCLLDVESVMNNWRDASMAMEGRITDLRQRNASLSAQNEDLQRQVRNLKSRLRRYKNIAKDAAKPKRRR